MDGKFLFMRNDMEEQETGLLTTWQRLQNMPRIGSNYVNTYKEFKSTFMTRMSDILGVLGKCCIYDSGRNLGCNIWTCCAMVAHQK